MPAARTDIPALTGLRGVAALWVMAFHAWSVAGAAPLWIGPYPVHAWLQTGYFGVDLFFVLSGFLLGLPFARARATGAPRPSWRRFWRHRLLRVLPAYWVQIAILVVVALAAGAVWSEVLEPARLLAHLTLTTNFMPGIQLYNTVYWTLPVEWNFYLVLPLMLAIVLRARSFPVLLAAIAASVAFRVLCLYGFPEWSLGDAGRRLSVELPARLDQFVLGILAARWYASGFGERRVLPRGAALVSVLALTLVVHAAARFGFELVEAREWFVVHYSLTGLVLTACLLVAACSTGIAPRVLGRGLLAFSGRISYSLYLWHAPLVLAAPALAERIDWPLGATVVLMMGASVVVAAASYRWVEEPFLRLRRRHRGSATSVAPTAPPA